MLGYEYEVRKGQRRTIPLDVSLAGIGTAIAGNSLHSLINSVNSSKAEYLGYIDPALPLSIIGLTAGVVVGSIGGLKCYSHFF